MSHRVTINNCPMLREEYDRTMRAEERQDQPRQYTLTDEEQEEVDLRVREFYAENPAASESYENIARIRDDYAREIGRL